MEVLTILHNFVGNWNKQTNQKKKKNAAFGSRNSNFQTLGLKISQIFKEKNVSFKGVPAEMSVIPSCIQFCLM